jgi:rRNA maturation protein Nop10
VVDNSGPVYCPQCGSEMNVSDPEPVSILSRHAGAA